jgi:hypothetical protein
MRKSSIDWVYFELIAGKKKREIFFEIALPITKSTSSLNCSRYK